MVFNFQQKSLTEINFSQVVHEVGLCITLFDITEISDSYILPGDGSAHTPGILVMMYCRYHKCFFSVIHRGVILNEL